MARILTSITDEEYRRATEFEKWMKTQARVVQLTCLILGHEFPDPFSDELSHELLPAGQYGRKRNTIQLTGPCQREIDGEHCGTIIRKLLGPGGVIAGTKPIYDYEQWYKVPAHLMENGWLSRAQRGVIREYLYVELPEQRKAEAAKAARLAARLAKRAQAKNPA